jgi:endonuclease VIII-like 1
MPEIAELMIMSDFINKNSENRIYDKIFFVEKENKAIDPNIVFNEFKVKSKSSGKELVISIYHYVAFFETIDVSVFMGMSGNWKFVPTEKWNDTKHVRLRLDTTDGYSLLLYGGYLGPKFKVGGFKTGVKRGPDPIKEFELFKQNVLSNIQKPIFNKPIYEVLLNQTYFSGIGNYLRSTILYYLDANPFLSAKDIILENPQIFELCKEVPLKAYKLNGGQIKDWKNPFNTDPEAFSDWVFYQKGYSCKDSNGRTFWYNPKWEEFAK